MTKNTVSAIVEEASKTLRVRGDYGSRSIEYFESTWKQFLSFCASNEIESYQLEYVDVFLSEIENHVPPFKPHTIKRKRDSMKILEFCARNEVWKKGVLDHKDVLSKDFSNFISSQDALLRKRNYSEITCTTLSKQAYSLLHFFQINGVQKLSEVNRENITQYAFSLMGHAKSTLRCELSRIRQILMNAYLLEYAKDDLSVYVPSFNLGQPQSNVKIWKSAEINKVLDTVDRSNPKGLRDAAFITIASEFGMRSKDICNLKLSNIDWELCTISFEQSKTGKVNTLPLSEKVGTSIIAFLQVRPDTECEYLFVNLNPPYDRMKSFNSKFHRYVHRAGVTVPKEAHHGLHSLRATLATRLMEENVLPDDIAALLGHSDRESLHNYIRMDIEHLRQCALSFEDGDFV